MNYSVLLISLLMTADPPAWPGFLGARDQRRSPVYTHRMESGEKCCLEIKLTGQGPIEPGDLGQPLLRHNY